MPTLLQGNSKFLSNFCGIREWPIAVWHSARVLSRTRPSTSAKVRDEPTEDHSVRGCVRSERQYGKLTGSLLHARQESETEGGRYPVTTERQTVRRTATDRGMSHLKA